MKKLLMSLLLPLSIFLIFTACSRVDDATLLKAHKAVENGAVIIDVRTPKEFREKHVKNAINIELDELMRSVARVPKNKVLILYCQSGSRSNTAAQILSVKGWSVIDVATQADFERKVEVAE